MRRTTIWMIGRIGRGRRRKDDDRNNSTIFLRNLPFTATDDSLYEHFTQFGPLRYARVVLDHETERPRGTGFVCFWKVDDANTCIREAPRGNDVMAPNKDKPKANTAMKHSVLQNENTDPSGRYTSKAVSFKSPVRSARAKPQSWKRRVYHAV